VAIHFDLNALGRHGRGIEHLDRIYEPAAFTHGGNEVDEGYAIRAPVHLVLDVEKQGLAFVATGRVEATLRLECGRCLDPFDVPVASTFELRYLPAVESGAEAEQEVRADDLTTAYYHGHTLDLEDLMREQFQLALPMKPLCDEACKGLCPTCGANLNTNPCDCQPSWVDPRLKGLSDLFKNAKES
jgi:uncharacterized protein